MRPLISGLLLLAAACSSVPAVADPGPLKDVVKDPARLHAYFTSMLRQGEIAQAHKVLSTDARRRVPYEVFFLSVRNTQAPDLTLRVLTSFDQRAVSVAPDALEGTVRWCSPEFGLCRDYRVVADKIGTKRIWGLDFTRENLEELLPAALAWFRRQREAADGRIYAYPPDWTYARVDSTCTCPK